MNPCRELWHLYCHSERSEKSHIICSTQPPRERLEMFRFAQHDNTKLRRGTYGICFSNLSFHLLRLLAMKRVFLSLSATLCVASIAFAQPDGPAMSPSPAGPKPPGFEPGSGVSAQAPKPPGFESGSGVSSQPNPNIK